MKRMVCSNREGRLSVVTALCIILCFFLGACGAAGQDAAISDLLSERDSVQEVFVLAARYISGEVLASTNEEEKEAILDALYGAELSGFEDAERTGAMGQVVSLKIQTADGEKYVEVLADNDAQYLIIWNEEKELCKRGPADAFAFKELSQLVTDVLGNKDDPNYAGKAAIAGTDFEAAVSKGNSALAKSYLDKAIVEAGASESEKDISYDITLEIGETRYEINSDTGVFFRDEAGEKIYARLEDRLLREVKTLIGVLNATS